MESRSRKGAACLRGKRGGRLRGTAEAGRTYTARGPRFFGKRKGAVIHGTDSGGKTKRCLQEKIRFMGGNAPPREGGGKDHFLSKERRRGWGNLPAQRKGGNPLKKKGRGIPQESRKQHELRKGSSVCRAYKIATHWRKKERKEERGIPFHYG